MNEDWRKQKRKSGIEDFGDHIVVAYLGRFRQRCTNRIAVHVHCTHEQTGFIEQCLDAETISTLTRIPSLPPNRNSPNDFEL